MASAKELVSRFAKIRDVWPLNPARRGRDLGEYIKGAYAARFEERLSGEPTAAQLAQARQELEALESIHNSVHKQKYARAADTTFSGKAGSWGFTQLASAMQSRFNKGGFFERLTGNATRDEFRQGPEGNQKK
eukprot:m.85859 g.85859  ORF g.85859 m.85859 type:complete len:133 (-) comp14854_c1_seq1:116-514(-)